MKRIERVKQLRKNYFLSKEKSEQLAQAYRKEVRASWKEAQEEKKSKTWLAKEIGRTEASLRELLREPGTTRRKKNPPEGKSGGY